MSVQEMDKENSILIFLSKDVLTIKLESDSEMIKIAISLLIHSINNY